MVQSAPNIRQGADHNMDNNYLITGYWGEPHVTAENDRGINAAMFGAGRFVLPVGRQFEAEYIGNNTVRIYDGKLVDNGAAAGIPAGDYIDVLIANTGQGLKRNDLIVFQYSQDASTLIERGTFVVVQGTETSGTPSDPQLTQADLLSGDAVFDQMALWRVSVSGGTIAAPQKVFTVSENLSSMINAVYPVGSVYISANSTSPASLFGGSWTRIQDKFLLSAGSTYSAGSSGGSNEIYISSNNQFPMGALGLFQNTTGETKQVAGASWANQSLPNGNYIATNRASGQILDGSEYGKPINYMPPYLAVYVWERTA